VSNTQRDHNINQIKKVATAAGGLRKEVGDQPFRHRDGTTIRTSAHADTAYFVHEEV